MLSVNINKTAESKFTGRASALDGTGTQFSTGTIDIKEGLAIYTFTFAKPVGNDFQINTDTSKVQSVGVNVWGVFVNQNDISLCKSKLEGGLNSTETIILNNSQQYPIYANEEDKANKKVILLNGFNDIYDTFEIKEDGSGLMTKKFMIIDDSLIDKWIISSQGDPSVNRWQLETDFYKLYPAKCTSLSSISNILASTLNAGSFNSAQVKAGIVYAHTNKTIGVSTEKTISSIEQFKEWFRGQLIIYELDIPIVTHIPKELVPTVRTHKTNILEVGGAVKPSSFKVTVPVDRIAEIEARLQALESTTVDVVLNK